MSNGGAGLCIWGVCLAMFIVMCLAAAKGLGFSLPYEGVEVFVVACVGSVGRRIE